MDTATVTDEVPEASAGQDRWRNRIRIAGAAVVGAVAVGVCWLVLGGGTTGSTASFQVSPGIPPVVFLYLDNVHIASYLAQLQGGAATTEVLSRQASESRNASFGSNGVGVGASAAQQSTAQLSLTVNDQSRFTDLLGQLQADRFLQTINMAAPDRVVRRQFAAVPDGGFVRLSNCVLSLPSYVQDEQLWRAARGRISVTNVAVGQGLANVTQDAYNTAIVDKAKAEGVKPPGIVGAAAAAVLFQKGEGPAKARSEMDRLVRRVGTNPRVPLSSCRALGYDGHTPDLLMPIRLGAFTANQTALAGRVTLVAKVMLAVRHSGGSYVDIASLQQWSGANFWTGSDLPDDATVLAPGYVLQPIAIYK